MPPFALWQCFSSDKRLDSASPAGSRPFGYRPSSHLSCLFDTVVTPVIMGRTCDAVQFPRGNSTDLLSAGYGTRRCGLHLSRRRQVATATVDPAGSIHFRHGCFPFLRTFLLCLSDERGFPAPIAGCFALRLLYGTRSHDADRSWVERASL